MPKFHNFAIYKKISIVEPIQKDLDENAQLAKIDKTKVDDERYLQHEVSDPQFNYEGTFSYFKFLQQNFNC